MSDYYFRVSELIHKERLGIISREEKSELEKWLAEAESHRIVYEQICSRKSFEEEYLSRQKVSGEAVWARIEKLERRKKQLRIVYWGVAAVVLLCLTVGIHLFVAQDAPEFTPVTQSLSYDSIRSGERKAILQLSDGKKIILQGAEVQLQTEVAAIRQVDQELRYIADSVPALERINVLTTPNGGEFNIVLSDGTRVWLNAGSQLTFPEVFVGNMRQVKLQGEAYFEVAKLQAKPFIVKTSQMDIKVLGTHFNVKAFPEDKRTTTTLAEGAVELYAGGYSVALKPDQQGEYREGSQGLLVREVDAGDYMAWKNGKFVFRRERLESILEVIARWYNVEVFYQNQEVRDILFSGKMDRYGHVRELLDMIEKTEKVKFDLSNQGLIVRSR